MRILLETDNAIVSYDEPKKALVVSWTKPAESEEFYLVYTSVLKGFKIFFASTLILDLKKFGKLGKNNLNYLTKHVLPMAAKCGMRKLVLIDVDLKEQQEIAASFSNFTARFSGKIIVEEARNFDEAFSRLVV